MDSVTNTALAERLTLTVGVDFETEMEGPNGQFATFCYSFGAGDTFTFDGTDWSCEAWAADQILVPRDDFETWLWTRDFAALEAYWGEAE